MRHLLENEELESYDPHPWHLRFTDRRVFKHSNYARFIDPFSLRLVCLNLDWILHNLCLVLINKMVEGSESQHALDNR